MYGFHGLGVGPGGGLGGERLPDGLLTFAKRLATRWRNNPAWLRAWQRGATGYPIVSHAIAREAALEAFARIKSTRPERRTDPEPMRRKSRRAGTG